MAKGKHCIGLDIGSSAVKLCVLKGTSKGPILQHFDHLSLPPETIVDGTLLNASVVADAIQELIRRNKIKQKEVAISVSGNTVIIRKIPMSWMTREELEDSIQWEAEQYIPFDIKEVYIGYEVLARRQEHQQMDVGLVAAKREMIDDYVNVCTDSGLKPIICDVDAFALQNMYEANYGFSQGGTVVLLDVGNSVVTMNVVTNGQTMFTRDLSLGGADITEEIQKRLNITYQEAELYKMGGGPGELTDQVLPQEVEKIIAEKAEDISNEIQRSLDFYSATAADDRIDRIIVSGGTAAIPSLVRVIERASGVPAEVVDPFRQISVNEQQFSTTRMKELAPIASIAVGLALRRTNER